MAKTKKAASGPGAKNWVRYRLEAFGDPYLVWHDGADFVEFQKHASEDPETAERMLIEGLHQDDSLAAKAIANSDLPPEVQERLVPVLKTALIRSVGGFRVAVAEALVNLTSDEDWSGAIVEVLQRGAFWNDRMDAAIALARFTPTIDLIAGLVAGVQDPDYLVRYHSSNALLRYGDDHADIVKHKRLFRQIRVESTPEQWAEAASELGGIASAAIAHREAGEMVES